MPNTVALFENIFEVALWVKYPRWPPFVQGQTMNWYHFWHNRDILYLSILTIPGFSCMLDIVVLPENIFDIVLWVKNTRWPPFVQGQTINWYHFRHNRGIFLFFFVSIMGFQVCRTLWWCRKYFRYCIVSEISKMAAICSRSSNKFISFST